MCIRDRPSPGTKQPGTPWEKKRAGALRVAFTHKKWEWFTGISTLTEEALREEESCHYLVGNLTKNEEAYKIKAADFKKEIKFPPKTWKQLKRPQRNRIKNFNKQLKTYSALIKNAKELEDLTVNCDLFQSTSNLGNTLETLFALNAIKDSDDVFLLSQIPEFPQLVAFVAVGGFMIVAVVVVGVRAALRRRNKEKEQAPLLGKAHTSTYSSTA